jgi:hypothetical protein
MAWIEFHDAHDGLAYLFVLNPTPHLTMWGGMKYFPRRKVLGIRQCPGHLNQNRSEIQLHALVLQLEHMSYRRLDQKDQTTRISATATT